MDNHRRTIRGRPPSRIDSPRPARHAVHVAQRDIKRLGEAIETRRHELGITQAEFAERGDLALATVQRVESGKINPRAKTWKGLDQGAGWSPGTAQSIAEGSPMPDDKPEFSRAKSLDVDAGPETIVDAVADLVRVLGEDEAKAYLSSLVERTARQDASRHRASGE